MDADVIIVGAGPVGLMLAGELCLAGVRPLVLERQPRLRETPKANGFNGQIVELLRFRGLLDRVEAASGRPVRPAPGVPFGGMHLDFSHLADPPIWAVPLPQPRLERLLGERAGELGAGIRRGHEVAGVSQDDATVAADVRGPQGPYRVTARYLVGCDGAHSRVRDTAGIPFPGTTYPEVNRLGQVTVPDSVTQLGDGTLDVPGLSRRSSTVTSVVAVSQTRLCAPPRRSQPRSVPGTTYPEVNRLGQVTVPDSVTQLGDGTLDVPGLGQIRPGFTRTARGVFAFQAAPRWGSRYPDNRRRTARSDDAPMTLTEAPGQHPPRARRGPAVGRSDPAAALPVPGPASRTVP